MTDRDDGILEKLERKKKENDHLEAYLSETVERIQPGNGIICRRAF